jgi:hypothetical protein
MKHKTKLGAIITMIVLIGFVVISCDNGSTKPCAHAWGEWTNITLEPTCVATGTGTRKCTICDATDTNTTVPIDPVNHNLVFKSGTATCTVDGDVTWKCDRENCVHEETEENRPPLGHDWDYEEGEDWNVILEAHCMQEGIEQRLCQRQDCDDFADTGTEERPLHAPDNHDIEVVSGQAPTCLVDGHGTIRCKRDDCEFTESGDVLDATGHNFIENWQTRTAATCNVAGERFRRCTNKHDDEDCDEAGYEQTQPIDPQGHNFENDWNERTPADCNTDGLEYRHCTREHNGEDCNETGYEQTRPIDAGHDWSGWDWEYDATCVEPEKEMRYCYNCYEEERRDSPTVGPLGHDFADNWQPDERTAYHNDITDVCGTGDEILTCTRCPQTTGNPLPSGTGCLGTLGLIIGDIDGVAHICIPDTATSINGNVFDRNQYITSVRVGNNVTSIGMQAFYLSRSIKSITIPVSVTSVGEHAFFGWTNAQEIRIYHDTLTPDGWNPNWRENCLATIINQNEYPDGDYILFEPEVPEFDFVDKGDEYEVSVGTMTGAVVIPAEHKGFPVTGIAARGFHNSAITSVTIPATVEFIGEAAFSSCANLTTVIFAEESRLETIWHYAFSESAITSITIPASVTTIGWSAFGDCEDLAEVIFADGSQLESILISAFDRTAITNIIIPASVGFIDMTVFRACKNLVSVTVLAEEPPTLGEDVFFDGGVILPSLTEIRVPAGSVAAYKEANGWSEYAHLIVAITP